MKYNTFSGNKYIYASRRNDKQYKEYDLTIRLVYKSMK